ncbi:MAG: NAD-dependent succinate-semialdehyde dehydrogenase [Woeseiaceae bacterium]|nr:NAD-dependent succinate-semialdehyde dehydrogenase [Woeseiaceae bacterium]
MSDKLISSVPTNLYIGGTWVPSADGNRISVVDPATELVIANVASAAAADATSAVDAAFDAGADWSATAPRARAEVLRKAFELMTERRHDLATIISREEGKTLAEGLGEVAYAAEFFRWYAEEAPRTMGHFGRSPAGANNILVDYVPVGVSLLITPWNFPAAMGTRKIAPALAAGCTVILKPASETPLTALALAGLLEEAGVPAGVVNVLPSSRSGEISNRILSDSRVGKLSFTGSTEVGRVLLAKASERVVNCSMELGGNAPFIVLDDADIELAVSGAMIAKMRNAGESCIGANRFYVHASIADEFADRFAAAMAELKVGPGLEDGVDVGPLVNASTRDKVEHLVNEAVSRGARVLTGGKRPSGRGFFYEPTVVTNIDPQAEILHTEIFGPVAPIVPFDTLSDVITRANETIFGLAAYVFSGNVGRALAVAQELDAGIIGVNRGFVSDPAAPFGGMKQSGLGREGSQDGMHEFLEKKYIAVDW